MSRKYLLLFFTTLALYTIVDAQVFIGGRYGRPHYARPNHQRVIQRDYQLEPRFQPTINISVGYGFPNLDKEQLPDFYNFYSGAVTQKGPLTGAIDYRFSRGMSIGLLVTHGSVTRPYYDYNDAAVPAMTGYLNNWSYMLNLVKYIPAGEHATLYLRTAIGVNSWDQQFTDAMGNKLPPPVVPSALAYQAGFGAQFNLSKNAALFVEAGYGKYILHSGLSFKF